MIPELIIIAAQGSNRVIGRDNQLCWHLPEDLAHFKRLTLGKPVVMGRNTWESLPAAVRPLPGRLNIVLTRQADYPLPDGVLRAESLEQAIKFVGDAESLCVIGGAQLYAQALPLADRVELTRVDVAPEGDAFFPVLEAPWQRISRREGCSPSGLGYAFETWVPVRFVA